MNISYYTIEHTKIAVYGDGYVLSEIILMLLSTIIFEVDEDIEDNSYNLDTVYKALADDNPKIRTAILRNESLKDLRWRYRNVLEIASHDEDATVKAFAVEELSKL